MDMDILYSLQTLRESLPDAVTTGFLLVSDMLGTSIVLILAGVAFWCFDKRSARLVIYSLCFNLVVNSVAKNLACVYRPWIQDARLHVAPAAEASATGYSFPSGHTTISVSLLGTAAALAKKRWFTIVAVVLMVLVMISRMWLGCHTPQDVLVGFALALVGVFFCIKSMDWAEAKPGRDLVCLGVGLAVVVAVLVFLAVKPYPMDYVDGVLLVDPYTMITDGYRSVGVYAGALVGWFVERRYIEFEQAGSNRSRVIRVLVGLVILGIAYAAGHALCGVIDYNWGKFIESFMLMGAAFVVAPYLFKRFNL